MVKMMSQFLAITILFLLLSSILPSAQCGSDVSNNLSQCPDAGVIPPITQGELLRINGTVSSPQSPYIQISVWGTRSVLFYNSTLHSDGSWEYSIPRNSTGNMTMGDYFVIIQGPGKNRQFDVYQDPVTNQVILEKEPKQVLFSVNQVRNLIQNYEGYYLYLKALESGDSDDTYSLYSVYVRAEPSTGPIGIDPIGDHDTGDCFSINGTASFPPGTVLSVRITSSSFKPGPKIQPGVGADSLEGTSTITNGPDGKNLWTFPVNASRLAPDEYLVIVSEPLSNSSATSLFTLYPAPRTTNTVQCNHTDQVTLSPSEATAWTQTRPAPVTIALAFLAIGITFVAMGILQKK